MNNIYVDELPDDCIDCPCESEYYCNLLFCDIGFLQCNERHPKCPLLKLSDRLAEERNKVVQKIRKKFSMPKDEIPDETTYSLNEFLDQIERGTDD